VRNVLVGLLWLSVLVSLSVYAYRIYRRITRGPKAEREAAAEATVTGTSTASPVSTSLDRVLDKAAQQAAPADTGSTDSGSTDSPPHPDPPAPSPPPPASDRPSEGRSGLFAPSAAQTSSAEPGPASASGRATVAELLSGVSMPCDLVPVIDPDGVLDPYRVAFSTTTAPAAEVGAAVGDELERLGFSLRSLTANQVEATREGQRLTVTVRDESGTADPTDGTTRRTLPPGSVVVEFES
jgi:hypothetical protein